MKRLLIGKKRNYLVDPEQDFHCSEGMIVKEDLAKEPGTEIRTNKDKPFILLDATFIDLYREMKRGAQIMTPKDIGYIIATTGLSKEWRVLDAGSGSGGNALFLAHLAKEVTTYDINEQHLSIVRKNKEMLGIENLEIKEGDITQGVEEKDIDLFTLDIKEPWLALETAKKALKTGGFLVVYTPHITQAQETIGKAVGFIHLKTIELIEREWIVDEKRARPDFRMLGHTGFMTFFRKTQR